MLSFHLAIIHFYIFFLYNVVHFSLLFFILFSYIRLSLFVFNLLFILPLSCTQLFQLCCPLLVVSFYLPIFLPPFVHLVHYVVLICCYSFLSFSLPLSCTSLCCPYLYFSLFFPVLSFHLLINLPSLIFVSFLFFSLFLCCILFISLCCPYLLCLFSPFFLYINLRCPCFILSLSSQKVHYHYISVHIIFNIIFVLLLCHMCFSV